MTYPEEGAKYLHTPKWLGEMKRAEGGSTWLGNPPPSVQGFSGQALPTTKDKWGGVTSWKTTPTTPEPGSMADDRNWASKVADPNRTD